MLKRYQSGFSMIELLIALVILSVGLLGVAGIQAIGLRTASVALDHNTATHLSVEILERIRTNAQAFDAGAYDGAWDADSTLTEPTCAPCTAAEQAKKDIHTWVGHVVELNEGKASIRRDGDTAIVTIEWVDITFGGNEGKTSADEAQSFVLAARMK